MLDTPQTITIIVLITVMIAYALVFLKESGWKFIKGWRSGVAVPPTLKDAILTVLMFPIFLACCMSAWWLYYFGWDGLTRTLLIAGGSGFVLGVFMGWFIYLGSRAVYRRAKKRMSDSHE